MKGLNLLLAVCFAVSTFNDAVAAVTHGGTTRTQSATQRGTGGNTTTINSRTSGLVKSRKAQNTTQQNISSRTASNKNIVTRSPSVASRTATTTQSRAATTTTRPTARTGAVSRTATTPPPRNTRGGISRAATTQTRESVMQRDFSKCKSVFFDCMDEFCANKDAQLKRCACSTRANEFTATQKSLDNVEDKLLDFSQRLLQVNMDPADAAVINQASEGELAYYATADKTASKRALDDIAQKLNANFDSAGNNMSALSWSLDIDSAFDSVDSLSGASTAAKSGTSLRNAALPICREMAAEVCASDDISLVENSYNMAIEQDCNTVKKAFETQTQAARSKILESGALLDMTRLNNYQTNNSDDILTCKSKMLDMLTNTNVCGDNLTKCLDISGRYINPTTGEVFLSPDLVNLTTLIVRPTASDTWANTPKNSAFVSYLNSKKKYIEPATKNCESIADDVWGDFIEDALAKIKLAQNAKLEEVRQSCTTLLTECLDNANESLSNFDSRALSTFGVITDKTANALCENVKKSCTAVMQYNIDDTTISTSDDWSNGVRDIAATETYNKIINTCREIGRDCIVNSCKSITGNFGLCESINGSVNRHSILTRAACWDDVLNCVNGASDESINNIYSILPTHNNIPQNLYEQIYSNALDTYIANTRTTNPDREVYDICRINRLCATAPDNNDMPDTNCYRCRIAEQIWGHCKLKPDNINENPILIPNADSGSTTLLSWFAKNTHTDSDTNSCATSICKAGTLDYTIGTSVMCVAPSEIVQCNTHNILCQKTFTTPTGTTNCCPTNNFDIAGNCCMDNMVSQYTDHISGNTQTDAYCTTSNTTNMTQVAQYTNNGITTHIFCTGNVTGTVGNNAQQVNCDGEYIIVSCNGTTCTYHTPTPENNTVGYISNYSINYFINANGATVSDGVTIAITAGTDLDAYCSTSENDPTTQPNLYKCLTNDWDCTTSSNTNGRWMVKF